MKLSKLIILIALLAMFGAPALTNAADEIADANPDVNFSSLIINISYMLTAPDSDETCVCDWAISNEFIAALNPTDECETELFIFIRGGAELSVDVDCEGDEVMQFTQVFMAQTPAPAPTRLKGSGCSLSYAAAQQAPISLVISIPLVFLGVIRSRQT